MSRKDPISYFKIISAQERSWTERFAKQFVRRYLQDGPADPKYQLRLLDIYDLIIEPLMSGERIESIIRHPGLFPHHMYLCPESKKIVGIYDWQETEAQPMVLQEDFVTLANNRGHMPKSLFNYPDELDHEQVPANKRCPRERPLWLRECAIFTSMPRAYTTQFISV
jgi:hypothetical protein